MDLHKPDNHGTLGQVLSNQVVNALRNSSKDRVDGLIKINYEKLIFFIEKLCSDFNIGGIEGTKLSPLLLQRYGVVLEVGKAKKKNNSPALVPKRWEKLLEDKINKGKKIGVSEDLVRDFWNTMHKFSLELEDDIFIEENYEYPKNICFDKYLNSYLRPVIDYLDDEILKILTNNQKD